MATGWIEIIKRASMDAVANAQMCDLRYGKVTSVDPLKVHITNLFTLPESMLIVPEHLTDHEISITTDANTNTAVVHGALKVGDKVALLRKQGGQSYFILDRI